jgi:hypothetical protein
MDAGELGCGRPQILFKAMWLTDRARSPGSSHTLLVMDM